MRHRAAAAFGSQLPAKRAKRGEGWTAAPCKVTGQPRLCALQGAPVVDHRLGAALHSVLRLAGPGKRGLQGT